MYMSHVDGGDEIDVVFLLPADKCIADLGTEGQVRWSSRLDPETPWKDRIHVATYEFQLRCTIYTIRTTGIHIRSNHAVRCAAMHDGIKTLKHFLFPASHNVRLLPPLHDSLLRRINANAHPPFRILMLDRRTLNNMIRATKDSVHLLETNLLGLGHKEPHKRREQHVDAGKHVEGVEALILEEHGEELLDNAVDDVLGLRAHAYGLRADVHGEDFGSEDPDCCAPGGFVCGIVSGCMCLGEGRSGTYRRKQRGT
jgi:hypothetical protein